MKMYRLVCTALFASFFFLGGCLKKADPLPLPADLAAAPFPADSKTGGLEGIYISTPSYPGEKNSRCHMLYRFYPEGLVLYSSTCFTSPPGSSDVSQIETWFNQANISITRGDYATLEQQLIIRIVEPDAIHETVTLRIFQGAFCPSKMVLQEPGETYFSSVPSPASQPVLEFTRLDPGSPLQSPQCRIPGFEFVRRPTIVLSGGQALFELRTDPGGTCSLVYTTPDGKVSQGAGTGEVQADPEGICRWLFDTGQAEGEAKVTIRVGIIEQDLYLDVR
jgi:hypothetical protein